MDFLSTSVTSECSWGSAARLKHVHPVLSAILAAHALHMVLLLPQDAGPLWSGGMAVGTGVRRPRFRSQTCCFLSVAWLN